MFTTDADFERADWNLLAEGAVTLFWRKSLFDNAKASLRELDYRVVHVSCSTEAAFISDLSQGLGWMGQFGYEPWTGNLDALNDGLRGPPFSRSNCVALCFEGFHRLVAEDRAFAETVLDLIESQSRNHLVLGRRLVALVQTDDGAYLAPVLGGRTPKWTWPEFLNSSRTLGEASR